MGKLKYLMIHCTATPEGRDVSAKEIKRWHTAPQPEGRGWSKVGYAEMIHLNGDIQNLHSYDFDGWISSEEVTNGAKGMNTSTRHIVYVGGTDEAGNPKNTMTREQRNTLLAYCLLTVRRHPDVKICGHNQFSSKACPSFDVPFFLGSLLVIPDKNIYRG